MDVSASRFVFSLSSFTQFFLLLLLLLLRVFADILCRSGEKRSRPFDI